MRRLFHFDETCITLPKGTRVVLRTDLPASDGYVCKAGTVGVVADLAYDSYTVRTPAGHELEAQRDQLAIQRRDLLEALGQRQLDFEELEPHVVYSAVVGSRAWGLAGEGSDEDLKGVFVLPFEGLAGLWQPVDEIQDPRRDAQYWEVQKLVYQGLRADANTLELLWSPEVRVCTGTGEELLARRRMFVSRNIFGTFGRYAMSQFRKMRAAGRRRVLQQAIIEALAARPELSEDDLVQRLVDRGVLGPRRRERRQGRDALHELCCSLFDRGQLKQRGYLGLVHLLRSEAAVEVPAEEPRWKNAYNLLRLLCSGIRWLEEGEPLIRVEGSLRDELLAVKRGESSLAAVLERADELALRLEQAFASTRLPEHPDYDAAHAFLLGCRERAAREHFATGRARASTEGGVVSPAEPAPLAEPVQLAAPARLEIPVPSLRAFLARYDHLDLVVCSLVGSHSYGFPSRDSDFDLKAIHLAPAEQLVGLDDPPATEQFLGVVDGREIDFTSHEARGALLRLLRGDGNVLERICSPYLIAPARPDARLEELRAWARANLSKRFFRHYSGFFHGQHQLYLKERTAEGEARIKPLLYLFRVALTGVHLLRAGEVLADLKLLLELYPLDPLRELFRLKEQAELATVADDGPYLALIPELEQMLEDALARSTLPEEAPDRGALDVWLRRYRISRAGAGPRR